MSLKRKAILAGSLLAVAVLASAASAYTLSAAPKPSDPTTAKSSGAKSSDQRAVKRDGCGRHLGRVGSKKVRRIVHGEAKIQLPRGGFGNLTADSGTVTSVDTSSATVTIKRADGESIRVSGGDRFVICKDGKRSELTEVNVGDLARAVKLQRDDKSLVRLMVHSPSAASSQGS